MTKLLRGILNFPSRDRFVATIGKFDGLHLGHQKILTALNASKKSSGEKSLVISFYQNPACFFNSNIPKKRIISWREELEILNEFSVDYLLLLRFNKSLMEVTATEFANDILIEKLRIQELIVGEDAVIGKDREGDTSFLHKKFTEKNCKLNVISFAKDFEEKISSSLVRHALVTGDMNSYYSLTHRYYSITGKVLKGNQIGRGLGFPTANIKISNLYLPPNGVYASKTWLEGVEYESITNVGVRPTIINDSISPQVETFLINYQGPDFYQKYIKVQFLEFVRPEKKFSSLEELRSQIKLDLETRLKLS